jgi:hypothetical protein
MKGFRPKRRIFLYCSGIAAVNLTGVFFATAIVKPQNEMVQ